jgi:hypothetical protein
MRRLSVLILAGLFLTAGMFAETQDAHLNASVYVVHGIPGLDLALDPDLPVDVYVNDALTLAGLKFKQVKGPLSLPAGTYNIKIAPEGTTTYVIEADVPFYPMETTAVIAHLTADGGITASKFVYDMSPVSGRRSRFYFQHLAAAPSVDVWTTRVAGSKAQMFSVDDVRNGDKFFVEIRPKEWRLVLGPTGTGIELTAKHLELNNKENLIVLALGSLEFQTFTFKVIRLEGSLK